jgi:hypothetical protein
LDALRGDAAIGQCLSFPLWRDVALAPISGPQRAAAMEALDGLRVETGRKSSSRPLELARNFQFDSNTKWAYFSHIPRFCHFLAEDRRRLEWPSKTSSVYPRCCAVRHRVKPETANLALGVVSGSMCSRESLSFSIYIPLPQMAGKSSILDRRTAARSQGRLT